MAQLSSGDLRAALDFVAEAHSFEDVDAFRHGILPGLHIWANMQWTILLSGPNFK